MKNNGLIFRMRCLHFINKLNYFQITVLLDMVRERKQALDRKITKKVNKK